MHVVEEAIELNVRFKADRVGERTVVALRWVAVGGTDLTLVVTPRLRTVPSFRGSARSAVEPRAVSV